MSVPSISDSARADACGAVFEVYSVLISRSTSHIRTYQCSSNASRRLAVSHIFQHTLESVEVLLADCEATILTQDSEVEDLEDFWICGEELWLACRGRQLLHIEGDNKMHTTECVFGWI